jgi:hypothetical protein
MRTLHNIILIIIILSSFLLGASTLTRGHEWGDDFASYIMQAQSIMNGDMDKFIVHNTFTIFESSSQIGPVAYPWGYPLVLTPVLLFKGLHPLTLKLPGLFFFAAFLLCLYLLTEDRISRTERLILVSLFAFNPILIKHLDQILSDIPFLFSVFLASALIAKPTPKNNMRDYILAGVAIFFAFFIRTTGIIILVSFLIYQGYIFLTQQLNRKAIVMKSSIVVATFTLLWFTTSLIFPNGQGAYLRQLMGFTFEIFFTENVPGYFYLGAQFFGISPNTPWIYIYYVVVILFFIGTWSRHNKDLSILLFFIIYLGAMLVWPEWQGIRFVYPILPIFTYFVFQGINALVIKLPQQYRTLSTGAHYLLWLVVVGIFIFNSGTHAFSNLKDNRNINGPFDPHSSEVFNYIKTKTPPDSVIVFFKPRAMRLFTNRDSIMVLECENLLLGDYVVLHKKWEYSQILPNDIPDCNLTLKDVFENQRFIVYQTPK